MLDGPAVIALALALTVGAAVWLVELVAGHHAAFAELDRGKVERLGAGLASWYDADEVRHHSGRGRRGERGLISDEAVVEWAGSADRWWRRAALVVAVPAECGRDPNRRTRRGRWRDLPAVAR